MRGGSAGRKTAAGTGEGVAEHAGEGSGVGREDPGDDVNAFLKFDYLEDGAADLTPTTAWNAHIRA
ncbi:hypothetical protein GCM10010305_37830 [Streptomyces termitum]|uniref:Uncharacterized protein n=1 Tax=Streptomyces termitum TaxID=67368 RepID=A0A918WAS7_9ACTN|nr:hypothetical protein GCM10010305_37830 [Streptomyces termitum]